MHQRPIRQEPAVWSAIYSRMIFTRFHYCGNFWQFAFSALTLLVGRQEEHPASKN